ncbi:MAG TPA: L-threonylcarbamoyladenylate synthase [Chitinispirillaceae bacterium]|jgi:tRNA threonylcarbamoyl adenosine modification protein (Sua5/YciO/YrdC/YwlC family)|nr:L-threonylcarbamoyladenylate synthase [Chitinispirillaceae bacterium]
MIIYNVHPVNPQRRYLDSTARILKDEGGIAVYPTDTVYGMGACISNPKALDKISRILMKDKSRLFSFICSDFSQISTYCHLSNAHFKLMKKYLPGPFTFILPATNLVPKKICPKRKTVGVRIPSCVITLELVKTIGEPLANTSISLPGDLRGDPDEVRPAVINEVDVMLDAGPLDNPSGSTIIDLTNEDPEVIRIGKGNWEG